ncbi:hypothetical protein ARMGADRAFT_1032067 [Armillaria gallica]|uniref:Uncharacterized protein n=1 Tax=Armillaria gallica TaxID=47427 RepID=A0A2H3DU48_ARMGA|nr:hypothetical protein ARMGADRAFT_1032067 [Armillaria gallica]
MTIQERGKEAPWDSPKISGISGRRDPHGSTIQANRATWCVYHHYLHSTSTWTRIWWQYAHGPSLSPRPNLDRHALVGQAAVFNFALPTFPGYRRRNIVHNNHTRAGFLLVAAPFDRLCVPPSWQDDQAGKGQLCRNDDGWGGEDAVKRDIWNEKGPGARRALWILDSLAGNEKKTAMQPIVSTSLTVPSIHRTTKPQPDEYTLKLSMQYLEFQDTSLPTSLT